MVIMPSKDVNETDLHFIHPNWIRAFILRYLSLNLNQEALALDLLLSLFC